MLSALRDSSHRAWLLSALGDSSCSPLSRHWTVVPLASALCSPWLEKSRHGSFQFCFPPQAASDTSTATKSPRTSQKTDKKLRPRFPRGEVLGSLEVLSAVAIWKEIAPLCSARGQSTSDLRMILSQFKERPSAAQKHVNLRAFPFPAAPDALHAISELLKRLTPCTRLERSW